MKKVVFLHNIIAPYRTPLFDRFCEICHFTVIYMEKNSKSRKWDQNSSRLYHPHLFLNRNGYRFKLFGKKLAFNLGTITTIESLNPDIVILLDDPENIISMFLTAVLLKFKKKKMVLVSPRFSSYISFSDNTFAKIAKKAIDLFRIPMYWMADYIWCYSDQTVKLIRRFKRPHLIIDGFQGYPDSLIPKYEIDKTTLKDRYQRKEVIFVGYLSERKGIDVLVKAIKSVREKGETIQLGIIGTGNITQYAYDWIRFYGYKDGKEKFDILNRSILLCLPSHSDSWGWVVHEAQRIGLPVITTHQVVAKETLPDKAFVYNSEDWLTLEMLLSRALEMNFDEYQEWCYRSFAASENHTQEKAIRAFKKLLHIL